MLSTSDSSQSGRSARSASSRSFMQARIRSGGKREVTRWRVLIEARLREHPEWADNLIANTLGCSHMTVATVRTELEATCQIGQLDRHLGLDGKWRKNKCRTPPPSLLGRAMQV
jgi:hypothetical protein